MLIAVRCVVTSAESGIGVSAIIELNCLLIDVHPAGIFGAISSQLLVAVGGQNLVVLNTQNEFVVVGRGG